ncbi:MAG TPA: isocitrate/isopropylmalate family dehydrogenase [Bryobacteraceae bacterium]
MSRTARRGGCGEFRTAYGFVRCRRRFESVRRHFQRISAIVTGSIGLAPSATLDPTRRFRSMFEPVHGSAPDIAGKGVVNPLGAIFSAGCFLSTWSALSRRGGRANRWGRAAEGRVRTPDLGVNRPRTKSETRFGPALERACKHF